jgi:hypothetical protein
MSVEVIRAFGEKILSGDPFVEEPTISVTPDELTSLLSIPAGDPLSAVEVGFFNVLYHLIFENWISIDPLIPGIQSKLVEFIRAPLNNHSVEPLADVCIELYKRARLNWPELINAVFDETPLPITSFLLPGVIFWNDNAFVSSNESKIFGPFERLLVEADTRAQVALLNALPKAVSEKVFASRPGLLDAAWTSAIRILTEYPGRWTYFRPFLEELFIGEANQPSAAAAIAAISDEKSAEIVLQLIACLNGESLLAFLGKLDDIAAAAISETGLVPRELIAAIDKAALDEISEANLKVIAEFVRQRVEKESGLALFAAFFAVIGLEYGPEDAFSVIANCFAHQDSIRICLGLKCFECVSGYSDNVAFEIPDFSPHLSLLSTDSEVVRAAAFAALSGLIENGVFISEKDVNALLEQYPRISEGNCLQFFKLLRKLLRVEEVAGEVVDLVADFAAETLKTAQAAIVRAQLLSIICAVGGVREEALPEASPELVTVAADLLKSNESATFTFASRALAMFVSEKPELARRPASSLLPKLFDIAAGTLQVAPKTQGNVALALTSVVICLDRSQEFPRIVNMVSAFLESREPHLVESAAAIAEVMRNADDSATLLSLFRLLAASASATADHSQLDAVLNAARKILKTEAIPEDDVAPLLELILSGRHRVFERKLPALFEDKQTAIHGFLKAVAVRFPGRVPAIRAFVLDWFYQCPPYLLASFLEAIAFLADGGFITGEAGTRTAGVLLAGIAPGEDDMNEVLLGNLVTLVKADPTILDKDRLVAALLLYWEDLTKHDHTAGWRAQLGTGILELCALGAELDDDVVHEVLADFPYDARYGKATDLSKAICTMMDDPTGKWNHIAPAVGKTILSLLIRKDAITEHSLAQPVVDSLRRVLKKIFVSSPSVERELKKPYLKNRPLLNRLNSLLK